MKILIAYATTDGQTRKIARFVADRIADLGHGVELLAAADAEGLEPARFDGAILAGSLHAGGFQKSLAAFARAQAEALGAMPTLFLAVSLSAAGNDPEDWAGLRACLATFEAETGWHPGETLHVAGAFRFSEYDFFRAWAMRRIAEKKGEAVDPHADKEYTDWDALGRSVDAWLGRLGG
ncbi:MAG: flavodoxin domain-containing protein [Gemmobacter sp.]